MRRPMLNAGLTFLGRDWRRWGWETRSTGGGAGEDLAVEIRLGALRLWTHGPRWWGGLCCAALAAWTGLALRGLAALIGG